MKASILLTLLSLVIPIAASPASAQEGGLVVHEWGTFTTMQGSDGSSLSGLYLEEEKLPEFVYHLAGFAPDPALLLKGLCKPVLGATVKMETPVLYFYSPIRRDLSVRVEFDGGTISQWFPRRSDGETDNGYDMLDLTAPYRGWIQWDATVLSPDDPGSTSAPKDQETKTWTAPRATDANLVEAAYDVEKFLFYRGVGNRSFPLHTAFDAEGRLLLNNAGGEPIPYLFIYDRTDDGSAKIWWTGNLQPGESRSIEEPQEPLDAYSLAARFGEFEDALVEAGLYRKEAAAMLDTWQQSYFGTGGLRVFWIVPRSLTDKILPITIEPAPGDLQRVLVGRSEVLTPAFEKKIFNDISSGDTARWSSDRYYLAYRERVAQMKSPSASVQAPGPDAPFAIISNSNEDLCTIRAKIERAGSVRLRLVDMLGRKIFSTEENAGVGTYRREIGMKDLPSGIYFLTLQSGAQQWTGKIVRE
jgi:hypothetical protein